MTTETWVWMSFYRKGAPHHALTSSAGDEPGEVHRYTMCGRYIGNGPVRNGMVVSGEQAAAKESPACPRCFGGVW